LLSCLNFAYLFPVAYLNSGKCLLIDVQCNIKSQDQNAGTEVAGKNCLLISFAPVGADSLPVPSSAPISKSGEVAAFHVSLVKYSPFV